ncbi:hypothetical protein L1887_25840 [Cichorium endivia]|nr:hypothetical protein L1887_25840 [Cichorium endivia]
MLVGGLDWITLPIRTILLLMIPRQTVKIGGIFECKFMAGNLWDMWKMSYTKGIDGNSGIERLEPPSGGLGLNCPPGSPGLGERGDNLGYYRFRPLELTVWFSSLIGLILWSKVRNAVGLVCGAWWWSQVFIMKVESMGGFIRKYFNRWRIEESDTEFNFKVIELFALLVYWCLWGMLAILTIKNTRSVHCAFAASSLCILVWKSIYYYYFSNTELVNSNTFFLPKSAKWDLDILNWRSATWLKVTRWKFYAVKLRDANSIGVGKFKDLSRKLLKLFNVSNIANLVFINMGWKGHVGVNEDTCWPTIKFKNF